MSTQTQYESGRLTVTRIYDAPREAVFDAWIETSKVQQWWGCANTTNVVSEVEPKCGGKYHHLMSIKGAGEFPMNGTITEYDPPALLAYEMAGWQPGATMRVRVEFFERDNGTEVRLTHDGIPDEGSEMVVAGWSASFGKLDRFLSAEATAA